MGHYRIPRGMSTAVSDALDIQQCPMYRPPGMLYMGGKARIGKQIAAAILKHTDRRGPYLEPFVGGANALEHIGPHFSDLHISDVHPDLILLYQAIAAGWDPPTEVSEETWRRLKGEAPSALRGFAGFGCSFGGKWFAGYARNPKKNYARFTRNSLIRVATLLRRANIQCQSYTACAPRSTSVVYADPPYRGTTRYSAKFGHDHFWLIMQAWSLFGAHVFVSEYTAPEGWIPIWETQTTCRVSGGTGRITAEKLFVWGG